MNGSKTLIALTRINDGWKDGGRRMIICFLKIHKHKYKSYSHSYASGHQSEHVGSSPPDYQTHPCSQQLGMNMAL